MATRAPDERDLTTLADVKGWLGIPALETAADDVIQRLITSASVGTLQYLSRSLFLNTFTERRTGTGTNQLMLREFPIKSVRSLTIYNLVIQPSATPFGPGFTFDTDTIYLMGGVGVGTATGPGVYFGPTSYFPKTPPLAVTVTYKAGFDDDEVPLDIKEAVLQWVGWRFRERDRIGQSSKSLMGETTAFSLTDMPAQVSRMLQPYKRVAIV